MKLSDRLSIVASLALATGSAAGARHLLGPRDSLRPPVPVTLEDHFSDAEIRGGRRYGRPQAALGLCRTAIELGVLATLVGRQRRQPAVRSGSPARQALGAAGYGAGLTVGLTVVKLPLNAQSRRRSLAVGLSTQSWRLWAEDVAKATAIEAGLSAALLAGSSGLASRWPRTWWLTAAGGAVTVGALAGMLAPVLTDPLFNDFTPLPEGETRSDVLALADAAGVKIGEVYSVDASKRSTAVNAYVNGLGPTKRVVLFDTLLADYSRDEVRFVVSHELGHVRHADVLRQIAFLALSAPGATLAAQQLTLAWAGSLSGPAAVPALSLAMSVVAVPLALSGMSLSRAVERRTDEFGLGLSDAPEALISFFRRIAVQNRADVTAGRLTRGLLATHPPIAERIGAALAYQRSTAADRPRQTPAGS